MLGCRGFSGELLRTAAGGYHAARSGASIRLGAWGGGAALASADIRRRCCRAAVGVVRKKSAEVSFLWVVFKDKDGVWAPRRTEPAHETGKEAVLEGAGICSRARRDDAGMTFRLCGRWRLRP